jgi:hypothetical protein
LNNSKLAYRISVILIANKDEKKKKKKPQSSGYELHFAPVDSLEDRYLNGMIILK